MSLKGRSTEGVVAIQRKKDKSQYTPEANDRRTVGLV